MIKRLRLKFVCINMAVILAMLCGILGTILYFTQKNIEQESLNMMRTVAAAPVHQGRPGELRQDMGLPFFILEIGPGGELISAVGGFYDLSDWQILYELLEQVRQAGGSEGVLKEYSLRFCRIDAPPIQRLVFADISSEINTMNGLIKNCMLIGAASFLVFLGISVLLARWAVGPVEQAWEQQRQFVSDASHELKTPLTVILTNAELMQSSGEDPRARAKFTENILVMSRQMRELIETLLELARVDNAVAGEAMDDVDLSKLVSDAVLPFEPVYFEGGMELVCQIEEGIQVRGSASHLRQVVEIFLDNAQKYAIPRAVVVVSLERSGAKHCLMSVAGQGQPITPEDLQNIFKRFYRVDKARSRDGSYGLGLAIAQEIVHKHRGKIWAESREGLNTFFVRLPTK